MRKLDYEFIFTCGIVAFIAALGMVAGIVVLAGAKIYVYNLPLIVGSFLAIGGLLWGLLLVLDNDKVEKGQNIVTAQAVSEHFAVSYISVTIFTRLRLTLYRELHIISMIYCVFLGNTEGIWRKNEKKP